MKHPSGRDLNPGARCLWDYNGNNNLFDSDEYAEDHKLMYAYLFHLSFILMLNVAFYCHI